MSIFCDDASLLVLPAGTYVFNLANPTSYRHIVQIWTGDESQILATILAVPNYRLDPHDGTIFEFDERPGDSPMALHSWFYPGDSTGQEFVYPRYRLTECADETTRLTLFS